MSQLNLYIMDEDLEPSGIQGAELSGVVAFHADLYIRCYFGEPERESCPYVDFFVDIRGHRTIRYHFLEDATAAGVEKFEKFAKTPCFLQRAQKLLGDLQITWEGPGQHKPVTENFLGLYYDSDGDDVAWGWFLEKVSQRRTYHEIKQRFDFLRGSYRTAQLNKN